MAELHFSTEQIISEINGMADLAAEFLANTDGLQFRKAAFSLSKALDSTGVWQIPQTDPLETIESDREAGTLVGTLSFKWEVRRITPKKFSLAGNASTTIEIVNLLNGPSVSWNTDIGGAAHPGYRFHAQIRSDGKSIEIPRLPSILITPTDCLDFLLGELFQEKWTKHQLKKQGQTVGWTQGVRKRICHFLRQKAERAEQSTGITPWMTLKTWDFKDPKLTLDNE